MEAKLTKAAYDVIVSNTMDFMFIKDTNLVYRSVSMPFVQMAGKTSIDEVVGHTDLEVFGDEALAKRYIADDRRMLAEGTDLISYAEPIKDENGKARYGSTSKYVLRDENGEVIGLLGITKDITTEYLARQRYQQEFRYLFELPRDTYAVCYVDVDDWRVISQRRQNIDDGSMQACHTVEEMCRYAVDSIVDKESKAVEFYSNFTAERLHGIYESGRRTLSFKYERRVSDTAVRWVRNDINFLADVDSGHLCVMLSAKDINEIKLEQQKLVEAARLDSMTKLLNHKTTMKNIKRILETESSRQHALFMIDIDNFKALNDTMGHQAGDEFLIELAGELKHRFRETDVVGRIGGDEFFMLMRNVGELVQVEKKAKDILALVKTVAEDYDGINLSGSIGISVYPKDGGNLDELYSKADAALYEAKRNGKNKYMFC